MPDLLPILADFLTTAQGAYPDLDVTEGSSCVNLRWCSHTLCAYVDVGGACGDITITHNESEQDLLGGPDPLATIADLIVEHINETGTACGEGHRDAKPGTFAARVWVTLYRQRIERLDPEGRYSVKQSAPSSINLADFAKALDPDDTLF